MGFSSFLFFLYSVQLTVMKELLDTFPLSVKMSVENKKLKFSGRIGLDSNECVFDFDEGVLNVKFLDGELSLALKTTASFNISALTLTLRFPCLLSSSPYRNLKKEKWNNFLVLSTLKKMLLFVHKTPHKMKVRISSGLNTVRIKWFLNQDVIKEGDLLTFDHVLISTLDKALLSESFKVKMNAALALDSTRKIPPSPAAVGILHGGFSLKESIGAIKQNKIPVDVLVIDDHLPNGSTLASLLRSYAKEIIQEGFKAGIRLSPLLVPSKDSFFSQMILRDAKNKAVTYKGRNILDITNPLSNDYLEHLFKTYREEYGFTYFVLDSLQLLYKEGAYHSLTPPPLESLDNLLGTFRQIVGKEGWIMCESAPSLFMRDTFDIYNVVPHKSWKIGDQRKLRENLKTSLFYAFIHNRFWINNFGSVSAELLSLRDPLSTTVIFVQAMLGSLISVDIPETMSEETARYTRRFLKFCSGCRNGKTTISFKKNVYYICNDKGIFGVLNASSHKRELTVSKTEWDEIIGQSLPLRDVSNGALLQTDEIQIILPPWGMRIFSLVA